MKKFTDTAIGIETSLQGLTIQNANDQQRTVLQNNNGDSLSFSFKFHFFSDRGQAAGFIENEIQQVARNNDLAGSEGLQYPDEDTVMAIYYQFIDNVSHMVVMAAKQLKERAGLFYIGVTASENMTEACRQIFLDAEPIDITLPGKKDPVTEKKLASHTLRYMHGYTSNTSGGGGTSTDKSFSFFEDHSFRYSYSSVISMGSLGGSANEDQGFGKWQVRKDAQSFYLVLYWHLGTPGISRLQWGEGSVVFLDSERYLLDNS